MIKRWGLFWYNKMKKIIMWMVFSYPLLPLVYFYHFSFVEGLLFYYLSFSTCQNFTRFITQALMPIRIRNMSLLIHHHLRTILILHHLIEAMKVNQEYYLWPWDIPLNWLMSAHLIAILNMSRVTIILNLLIFVILIIL